MTSLQPNGPAPYTTVSAATSVVETYRDRGLGVPITADVLIRAGIQESLARRTLQSLRLLGLVDKDGKPTEQFEALRSARGDDEYRTRLQEWLRGVYGDVLQYADPSTDSYDRLTEAFRTYEPAGQRRAMASLLLGLWKHAGLPVVASTGIGPGAGERKSARPSRPKAAMATPRRRHDKDLDGSTSSDGRGLPPALVGLLHQIPQDGKSWTTDRRDDFLAAFRAVLDYTVPVRSDDEAANEDAEEED